jgi:hypothetical protein
VGGGEPGRRHSITTVRPRRVQTEDALDIRHEVDEEQNGHNKLMRELAQALAYSWVAGRRFSVVASEEEGGAAWLVLPAADPPGEVTLAAISDDLYLGSLT